ncbi:hypothetical protein D3C81_897750 [compost metagenome]
MFQAAAEVVAQVADQAPGKGQFYTVGQVGVAQLCQASAQALEEDAAIFIGLRLQLLQRPGAEQVETPAFGAGAGAVE